ncbi:protein-disulfide reductase DsbD domain-containing protein [Pseudoroseicyclus aestuarii]|uniref:Disulfide bond corrector protein DsbC n=1 Tax=Pseudoroseicyclus aestuarii TaxID=1795041 RepID=A0A318T8N7_9RHOB|nr:protein-disulfide reductase DsbD domain-containing protein [Pseudoroseicyclus aestuarii]PYE84738.1 disulfide bond corrector protein DsbC [Pseudoroseicyclus aestuarii]
MLNRFITACCATICLACPAAAERAMPLSLAVLPGWQAEDGTRMAALRLTLDPGWHTYWRVPGDVGIPPLLDWQGSENLASVQAAWPVPEVLRENGMISLVYTDQVVIPLALTPERPDQPIRLRGEVDLGVCETICMPVVLDISIDVAAGEGRRDPAILAAMLDRPQTGAEAGARGATCHLSPEGSDYALSAEVTLPALAEEEVVVVEAADPALHALPVPGRRSGERLTAVTALTATQPGVAVDRSALTITVLGGGRAVQIDGCTAG